MKYTGRIVSAFLFIFIIFLNILGLLHGNFMIIFLLFIIFWWLGRHYDKVKYWMEIDELTGVYNRRYLTNHFNKITRDTFSLSIVDVDDFKIINDTYGHQMGDMVLQQISSMLSNLVTKKDWIVRLGGDEFLVISKTECLQSQRIEFEIDFDISVRVSASVGTAIYSDHAATFHELMNIADNNMYQIKRNKQTTL